MIFLFIASIAGSIALGGWLLSAKAVAPKFSRLNPIKGLGRMFSLKSLVELGKAIAKVSVVLFFAIIILDSQTDRLLGLSREPTVPAMAHAAQILGWSFFFLSCTMIVIVLVDVPFQIYEHQKNLKMTKQEVKDEMKDSDGKPEIKAKIRALQQQLAQRKMMEDVPSADVIITNPEHYAVAIKYDSNVMLAPIMVAKGVDHMAMRIRELGAAHDVPIVAMPPLARAVYFNTEAGDEIPEALYVAVAQVLAYIYQLEQFKRGQVAQRPTLADINVPDGMDQE